MSRNARFQPYLCAQSYARRPAIFKSEIRGESGDAESLSVGGGLGGHPLLVLALEGER